jgi:imidazolonepropionase-like amidohydrolase
VLRTKMIVAALIALCSLQAHTQNDGRPANVTVFEGARLITGDAVPPIDDAVFVVDGSLFSAVGRRGEVPIPAGAARVDLSGKTVIPGKVDIHGHIGFQRAADGTMAKEYYTRANLIDHLERLAYYGVSAVVGVGDLVDRSDLEGGRTGWGDVPLRVREEVVPGAALFRTAGPGIASPGAGPQGHPSRTDVPYPVSTVEQARAAIADYARMRPTFVKIWIDDREGTMSTLPPPVYRAVIEAAHAANLPVAVHNVTLANAKELVRAGVVGWLHLPVRGGEVPDEELLAMIRDRATRGAASMWFHPNVGTAATSREDWSDPLLKDTVSEDLIEKYWGETLRDRTPEAVARGKESLRRLGETTALPLRRAGMKVVFGSDTGQSRFFIGWMGQLEFENWVTMGLTPAEAIVAATRDSAAAVGLNTGLVAPGRSADFVVLDANPLEDIVNSRRIAAVYLRGGKVDRDALKAKWRAESLPPRASSEAAR